MTQQIKFNGQIHNFPDDFTDDDIAAALGQETGPVNPGVPSIAQQTQDSRLRQQMDLPKLRSEMSQLVSQGVPDAEIENYLQQTYGIGSGDVTRMTVGEPSARDFPLGSPSLGAFGVGGGQGVLMQGGDEASAALRAGVGTLGGVPFRQGYDKALDENRLTEELAREASPGSYLAGQLTGAVSTTAALPGMTGARFAGGAATLPGQAIRGALISGAQGAIGGFNSGEGGLLPRLRESAITGAMGGAFGAAFPVASRGIRWGVSKVGDWLSRGVNGPGVLPPVMAAAADGSVASAAGGSQAPIQTALGPSDRRVAIERIATQLARDEIPPQELIERLNRLGPSGSFGDLGPNIKADVASVASLPGAGKTIAERLLINRQAGRYSEVADETARALGITQSYAQMRQGFEAMSDRASQMYQQALSAADEAGLRIDPSPVITRLNNALSLAKDAGQIRALREAIRLFNRAGGNEIDNSLSGLFKTKIAIDDKIADKVSAKALGRDTRRILVDASAQLQDMLKASSPQYREAAETFAAPIQAQEAFERGFGFFKDGRTAMGRDELAQFAAGLTPGEREAFRVGVFEGLLGEFGKRTYSTNVGGNILKTPDQVNAMRAAFGETYENVARILDATATKTDTYQRALMGSKTAQMLASQQDQTGGLANGMLNAAQFTQGGISDKARMALEWARRLAAPALQSERARAVLGQTMLDPRLRGEATNDIVAEMTRRAMLNQALGLINSSAGRAAPAVGPWGLTPSER